MKIGGTGYQFVPTIFGGDNPMSVMAPKSWTLNQGKMSYPVKETIDEKTPFVQARANRTTPSKRSVNCWLVTQQLVLLPRRARRERFAKSRRTSRRTIPDLWLAACPPSTAARTRRVQGHQAQACAASARRDGL